ncbi:MAG: hypothetical protein ED557_00235 [Balneola sp.]|nr:MAG: hypothetical protein ED557_00235 [Balneola sp.]
MRNFKLLAFWLLVFGTFLGCEIPKEPDFTTSQRIETPILVDKEYQFLGGGGSVDVLIDTTGSEFDSLFTLDATGFITLSQEQDFEFGDLNDAIPEITTDPTDFSSEVGELEIGSFSSGGSSLGSASFEEVTGLNPALVPAGTPIPGGTTPTPVNIEVGSNTDYFVSATIKRGGVEVTIFNNLGFDIAEIDIDLNSGATFVATGTISNVDHGASSSGLIPFSDGDVLADINVDISVTWNAQNTQANPGEMDVEDIQGVDLVASAVEAALTPQRFVTSSTTEFDDTEFVFSSPNHYMEMESGTIVIDPIVNGIDLTLDTLLISFPEIRQGPSYLPGDSLVIEYVAGNDQVLRSSTSNAKNIDLAGYRIFAFNNEVQYNIVAITENTQETDPSDQNRIITETDEVSSRVVINNLTIAEAFGDILPQTVILGDDVGDDGIIDVFNDTEAEITDIDGLEDLSSQVDGLEFTQASLTINYTSNIEVPTTIYASFVGTNGDGDEVYLSGKAGTVTEVDIVDPISGLEANGVQLQPDQMIKFELETYDAVTNPGPFSLTFDSTNSTVNQFLNNLPNQIRFIGKSLVNEDGTEATISTPLEFDPMISVNLPLAFSTSSAATFSDTTETSDLQDLPDENDDLRITQGLLNINYSNGLPLGVDLSLILLDENGAEVTTLPIDASAGERYELLGAQVDAITRFATMSTNGSIQIALTEQQLLDLSDTASIVIEAELRTTSNEEVKFRATDAIRISVSAQITIENTVN